MNGRREGSSYKFGDTLKFVCNRGFKLVGSSALECQADGTWNDSVAVCGGETTHCGRYLSCVRICCP